MFDFDAAMKQAEKDASSTALEALILAPSGGGKSTLLGTMGVKTLYLYAAGENHGVKAARSLGGKDVVPVCFDINRTPDDALITLQEILADTEQVQKHGFRAVVVDGASELETLIRTSQAWKKACATSKGSHNTFEEPRATIAAFRPVISALKSLQQKTNIHFAMTCILDVKDIGPNGEICEAVPRLQGYSVADSLVQQFGDVLVVGRMERQGTIKHKLQFATGLTKKSTDEAGIIKRMLNFSPRIAGLNVADLPPYLDADLKQVIELKKKKFSV
jgi:hypothetical protein